jgi:hypothetical protein
VIMLAVRESRTPHRDTDAAPTTMGSVTPG